MDLKYYDLLSTAIIGVVIVAVTKFFFMSDAEMDGIAYLALGYFTGYFINAIGSLFEKFYYITIGGKPSDKLLTLIKGQCWTGYDRVKFYGADKAVKLLKEELNDANASVQEMFECAMRKANGCNGSRVPAFNAQYAWSRTIFTTIWILGIVLAFRFYNEYLYWLIGIFLLLISWNRFKERGYYYAREVLEEYISQTN